MANLLLIADTRRRQHQLATLPAGYSIRPAVVGDVGALRKLYFEATDARVNSIAEAVEDMQKSVDGEYGDSWSEASLLVEHDDEPVAPVQTVHRAPWADTPDCPWINELFTDPGHRRRGLARALLTRCMLVVAEAGQDSIALRGNVDSAPVGGCGV